MKIKVREIDYKQLDSIKPYKHKLPLKQNSFLKKIATIFSKDELKKTNFTYEEIGMEKLNKDEPCLILMNHSCFLDLKIAFTIFNKRKFNIVCTDDGFVGKEKLMRMIGCIPTKKFISDPILVKDMAYCFNKLHTSVLLYPEASYTFDGCATKLPKSFSKCLKMFKVPVIMVKTYGAFLHDPLYNNLQLRNVNVKASIKYLLSRENVLNKSIEELDSIVNNEFEFDGFKYQQENNIKISEEFRSDNLNRMLWMCPKCKTKFMMEGKGINLKCNNCSYTWTLEEDGYLKGMDNNPIFTHIPDWYNYERNVIKDELIKKTYKLDLNVIIYALKDLKSLYKIGEGKLIHDNNGFDLTGCDNLLHFHLDPLSSYSLYSDFYWYEIGDMICIGDNNIRYYCFPTNVKDVSSMARIATEELYKLKKTNQI